jgi:large subunit ribosomal protein L18
MPVRLSGEKPVRKPRPPHKIMNLSKRKNRKARHQRVRAKLLGTSVRPRVSVFRSNRSIFIQFINDEIGKTLLSAKIGSGKGTKSEQATEAGKKLSEKAGAAGIKEIIFDRGGYKYHGRVKALAEGLRAGGLKF